MEESDTPSSDIPGTVEDEVCSEQTPESAGTVAQSVPEEERPELSYNELAAEVAGLKASVKQERENYLRALADLENYKKRAMKEKSELLRYQGERILRELLDVVDNFERARESYATDPSQLKAGIDLIYKMLFDLLGRFDVRPIESVGKDFDPQRFEALGRVETDAVPAGQVVTELRRGYMFKDKLLRVGQVAVAAPPAGDTSEEGKVDIDA